MFFFGSYYGITTSWTIFARLHIDRQSTAVAKWYKCLYHVKRLHLFLVSRAPARGAPTSLPLTSRLAGPHSPPDCVRKGRPYIISPTRPRMRDAASSRVILPACSSSRTSSIVGTGGAASGLSGTVSGAVAAAPVVSGGVGNGAGFVALCFSSASVARPGLRVLKRCSCIAAHR